MIDVPELDLYLKTLFYMYNANSEAYSSIDLSEEIKSWIVYFRNNYSLFLEFEEIVERNKYGFQFEMGTVTTMFGIREIDVLYDPFFSHAAQFLKLYPRLLYSYGFIETPPCFDEHKYFFRYFPKMVTPRYDELREGSSETIQTPSMYCMSGTRGGLGEEHTISYNVTIEVGLGTVVEEELHCQTEELHGTDIVEDVVRNIEDRMPELKVEIEDNLNRILSTEEKKFSDLGEALRLESASELQIFNYFVQKFEAEVIENTETVSFNQNP